MKSLTTTTDALNSKRLQAIGSVIGPSGSLLALLAAYRSSSYTCPASKEASFECGSILFGALSRELENRVWLNPHPTPPYLGICFDSVCAKVRTFKSPEWAAVKGNGPYSIPSRHACSLSVALETAITNATGEACGLNISALKSANVGRATVG